MKLENQVCSLDLSKRLKELGVKQESYFEWRNVKGKPDEVFWAHSHDFPHQSEVIASAFTVAELGEMLPFEIATDESQILGHCSMSMQYGKWLAWWFGPGHSLEATTEADARAKMLVYLLENKLLN